jgi:hypothetical protein
MSTTARGGAGALAACGLGRGFGSGVGGDPAHATASAVPANNARKTRPP